MDFKDYVKDIQNMISSRTTLQRKIKLLFVSTHLNQTNGYSKVTYGILRELAKYDWLQIVHYATQMLGDVDIGRKYPDGVKVLDVRTLEKRPINPALVGMGFSELVGAIQSEKPDIVFLYNDISLVCAYIEEIRKSGVERNFKIWSYIDQIYETQPHAMIDVLNRDVERVFCFTTGWKDNLKKHGITRPVDILLHGFDAELHRPVPKDLARQVVGLPKDAFVFFSMNRNQGRKRYDLLIMAFVELLFKHPLKQLFLLIVADKGIRGGYQLFDIFSREIKLRGGSVEHYGNRLLITAKDTCYKDEDVNVFYNMVDVGVSCAEAEGFGLCTFEQMGVGVPQIVPAVGGYLEYCSQDNCLLIKPSVRYYLPQAYNIIAGEAHAVYPSDVCVAMEKYVLSEDLRKMHGEAGRKHVLEYSWDKCCEVLIKRLKRELEDRDD